ncbi:UNVERIFIED_CONTAM: hypothetical protein Sradi_3160100, partial [Sesamum radiatum]
MGRLEGVSIYRGAPSISHLLFADDTLISSQASEEAIHCIVDFLGSYAWASGQVMNFEENTLVSLVQGDCECWGGGSGFQELRAFNRAMLAKQYWRIFKTLDSLLGRLLKACYFPYTSFLEAFRASRWARLLEVFHPIDVETILTIPLGRNNQQDVAIRHYSSDGHFSVPSAYHLACTLNVEASTFKGLYLGSSSRGWKFHQKYIFSLGKLVKTLSLPQGDVESWVRDVWENLEFDSFSLFFMTVWGLWKNRNGVLMEWKHQQPNEVLEGVKRGKGGRVRSSGLLGERGLNCVDFTPLQTKPIHLELVEAITDWEAVLFALGSR